MSKASIVLGLQFGDEGKGITTDFLCSREPKGKTIAVRFSGGQQAGHNVVIGDKSHIHSNYASGALRGLPSYITEHCTVYLLSLARETANLHNKGLYPHLTVHPLAKLTTPYDVALNRMREGIKKHGSVGLGVGATMERNLTSGYKLHAIDLMNRAILREKMKRIREYCFCKMSEEAKTADDISFFMDFCTQEEEAFFDILNRDPFYIRGYDYLREYDHIVFEGSQGIMLDMDHGIFPNVTYANTTSKNAMSILEKCGVTEMEIYYITRCYQTRHGEGWMSNEYDIKLIQNEKETNVENPHQGKFKIGELDYGLLNYAIAVDDIYSHGFNKNLVMTCMDQRPDFRMDPRKFETKFNNIYLSYSPESKNIHPVF